MYKHRSIAIKGSQIIIVQTTSNILIILKFHASIGSKIRLKHKVQRNPDFYNFYTNNLIE